MAAGKSCCSDAFARRKLRWDALACTPLRHLQAKIGFGLPPAACRQRIFVTAGDFRNRPFDIAERHSAIAVMDPSVLERPSAQARNEAPSSGPRRGRERAISF